MKFKDIPPFTSEASWRANYRLSSVLRTIEEFIVESNLQLNPDFQRGHVWTEEQQIKFMEFLLRGGKTGRDIYFNHPNWNSGSPEGEFVCVDGLQRLTACMRFLKNEIKVFGHLYDEFEDKIPTNIDLVFHVNDLKTRAEVLQWYLEFNSGGTVHTQEELDRVAKLLEDEKSK